MKTKILILILFVLIAVNYQSCKVTRHVLRIKKSVDSTALTTTKVQVATSQRDSANSANWQSILRQTKNVDLTINKITTAESETPSLNSKLVFDIDSINLSGDTAKAVADDGTNISIYKDKTTGKAIASIQRPGKKKKKTEISGIALKSSSAITNTNDSSKRNKVTEKKKDSAAAKINVIEKKSDDQTLTKDVVKKPTFLSGIGLYALIGGLVLLTFLVIKNWTKISNWWTKILKK